MECTESFTNLLSEFQFVFTQPTFPIFVCLMTGWILSHRRRFVTELIWSSGCTHKGHHSRYHRFFSKARWCLDALCCVLAKLLVAVFAPTGMIELAVDDTLCRKRGLTVYGTGMCGLKTQMQSRLEKWASNTGIGKNIAGTFQWGKVLQTSPWEWSPSDGTSSYSGRA